jgi:hypothetical protein
MLRQCSYQMWYRTPHRWNTLSEVDAVASDAISLLKPEFEMHWIA